MPRPADRDDAMCFVRHVLENAADQLRLYGSWARGDFHFDRYRRMTFSDLDLHGDPIFEPQWKDIAESVRGQLAARMEMRVSIRHANVHDQLSLPTSNWVTLATYAACLRGPSGDSHEKKAYLTAKTLLLLQRDTVEEPSGSVAARLGTSSARFAFAVKTGEVTISEFPEAHRRALLTPLAHEQQEVFSTLYERPHRLGPVFERIRRRIDGPELSRHTIQYVLGNMRRGK